MMSFPTISVVIPVLNRGDMLEKAILSVIAQNYPRVELIVMDGGSTDETLSVIQRYEAHITYWQSEADGSAALATNRGIEKATGEIIGLLMADDVYAPHIFAALQDAYLENPNADIFTCQGQIVSQDGLLQRLFHSEKVLDIHFKNICFYDLTLICCRFIKKSFYMKNGLYWPFDDKGQQLLTNDKAFLLQAVMNGVTNVNILKLGYTYVAHLESYSFGGSAAVFERHCLEHRLIAERLISECRAFKNRMWLRYWWHEQTFKLCLFYLRHRRWKAFFEMRPDLLRSVLWWVLVLPLLGYKKFRQHFRFATGRPYHFLFW